MKGILAAVLYLYSLGAYAEPQKFKLYNFQSPSPDACRMYAEDLGERLREYSGYQIAGSGCEYVASTGRSNVVVRYEADEPLASVSTHPVNDVYSSPGFYDNAEQCEAAKQSNVSTFSNETGLDPIASYCTFSRYLRPLPWFHVIVALGATDRPPQRISIDTTTPYAPSTEEIEEEIGQRLASLDITTQAFAWRPWSPHRELTVQTYGPLQIRPVSRPVVTIPGLESCNQARSDLLADLDAHENLSALTSICASPYRDATRFELYLATVQGDFRVDYSVDSFETLADCWDQREELAASHASATGVEPVATLCGRRPFQASSDIRAAFVLISD